MILLRVCLIPFVVLLVARWLDLPCGVALALAALTAAYVLARHAVSASASTAPELPGGPPASPPSRGRGVWAVLVLVLTAVDALATALLGWAPLTPRVREAARVIGDEYRAGAEGWIDAEVIEDDEPVPPVPCDYPGGH